jgi:hypothetical protein
LEVVVVLVTVVVLEVIVVFVVVEALDGAEVVTETKNHKYAFTILH